MAKILVLTMQQYFKMITLVKKSEYIIAKQKQKLDLYLRTWIFSTFFTIFNNKRERVAETKLSQ